MLTTTDPFEQAVNTATIIRAIELQELRDDNLAARIANAVGQLFRR